MNDYGYIHLTPYDIFQKKAGDRFSKPVNIRAICSIQEYIGRDVSPLELGAMKIISDVTMLDGTRKFFEEEPFEIDLMINDITKKGEK